MEYPQRHGEKVLRYVGKVARSFSLAHDVDEAKVQAKYSDGALQMTLPKKPLA